MSANLILGPLLRHVGPSDATVWVETDAPCEVEVRTGPSSGSSPTFTVEGHHYALVIVSDLEPGSSREYEVWLDGEPSWPEAGALSPAPVIRTIVPDGGLRLVYGSCRVSVPHEPPYTRKRGVTMRGGTSGKRYARDALYCLALRLRDQPPEEWPDALVLLGDQIYADEPSPGTRNFIESRRDPDHPPGVADFEEYTRLYWDAWKEPVTRWLLSSIPSAMIFDDHDVHDDWNTSEAWVQEMRSKPWWEERIVGAYMSYWVYQHLGNLSPNELEEDELFQRVRGAGDATRILREFAYTADSETTGTRWSYHRDFGGHTRLIMMDSRAGRVLEEGSRSMLNDDEWAWIGERATGDFDHLLFGTSLPFLLSPGLHHLEAWNEAVCGGAWGSRAAKLGEKVRQALDLEHWSAFHASFRRLARLLGEVGAGEKGEPPSSIMVLSGDVHHGYLAEMEIGDSVRSAVYQSVASPLRNPLGIPERLTLGSGWTRLGERIGKALARLAGVDEPDIRWRLTHGEPWFENHVSTLELSGREARLKVEKTIPEDEGEPRLVTILEHRIA